ncbi:hypothetical protein IGB42_04085 [Andreprevotia sp. IGB-42]|nr:hypothetical protein IGB42_04085 [Andreprevotia sp. IGB-42]
MANRCQIGAPYMPRCVASACPLHAQYMQMTVDLPAACKISDAKPRRAQIGVT